MRGYTCESDREGKRDKENEKGKYVTKCDVWAIFKQKGRCNSQLRLKFKETS